jgi:hypothetical protein
MTPGSLCSRLDSAGLRRGLAGEPGLLPLWVGQADHLCDRHWCQKPAFGPFWTVLLLARCQPSQRHWSSMAFTTFRLTLTRCSAAQTSMISSHPGLLGTLFNFY